MASDSSTSTTQEQPQKTQTAKMSWTSEHDKLLCREILHLEPYKLKHGSRERGQCWDRIATELSNMENPHFIVDQRAVRDRFSKLEKAFKRKMALEERASGISPEQTELDKAIEEIVELSEAAREELARGMERRDKNAEKERETAESVRKRSMERLAQTRERESIEEGKKKRKLNEGEVAEYLKRKGEREVAMKKEEIEIEKRKIELKEKESEREYELKVREISLREKEAEERKREQEARERRDGEMMYILQQQLQQQQAMFEQMRQQNEMLLSIFKNKIEKN